MAKPPRSLPKFLKRSRAGKPSRTTKRKAEWKDRYQSTASLTNEPLEIHPDHQSLHLRPWDVPGTPFKVGQKKVFLPNFDVTLLKTPKLGPHWAQFKVPLNFNKLDIRDYLYHVYNVEIRSVRSYINMKPIQGVGSTEFFRPGKKMTFRPLSEKKMAVELVRPFVWPKNMAKEEMAEFKKNEFNSQQGLIEEFPKPGAYAHVVEKRRNLHLRDEASRLLRRPNAWLTKDSTLPNQVTRNPISK